MAQSTISKAIKVVKDQTSIGIGKVASNIMSKLEEAIVKATNHDEDSANEKHVRMILNLMSYSRSYIHVCMSIVSKHLGKTRDWIMALKCLTLIHRVLNEGDPVFQEEILYAMCHGTRLFNMSGFRDEAHSSSWDHLAFVRTYTMYLDERLELILYDRKSASGGDERFGGRRNNFRSSPQNSWPYEYQSTIAHGAYGN